MAPRPRHVLVFEPDHRGHALEWLRHLLRHFRERPPDFSVSFLLPPELVADIRASPEFARLPQPRLLSLSERERAYCTHGNLAVSAFARWSVMRRHLRRVDADHGLFLGLDHLSLPLACGLRMGGRSVSGILFRPSVHYHELGAYRPSNAEYLRDLRKHLLYRAMLRNAALVTAFSLDPYFAGYAARKYRKGHKVRALSDPVFPREMIVEDDMRRGWPVPDGRVTFLLFGVLTARKGILQLLDALARLDPATAARTAVLVAGKVDPAVSAIVRDRLSALARRQPGLWLQLDDRRLSMAEIDALVGRADVVVAPYQRFVGSSGVMLWAARAGKPLLTQDFGLLGRLVRDHRLGWTTDTTDPDRLAHAITCIVEGGPQTIADRVAMSSFVADRSPLHFSRGLVEGIAAGVTG